MGICTQIIMLCNNNKNRFNDLDYTVQQVTLVADLKLQTHDPRHNSRTIEPTAPHKNNILYTFFIFLSVHLFTFTTIDGNITDFNVIFLNEI